MKKLLSMLLALALVLSLAGCNVTDFLPEDLTDFGSQDYETTLFPDQTEDEWLEFEKDQPADTTAGIPEDPTQPRKPPKIPFGWIPTAATPRKKMWPSTSISTANFPAIS